MAYLLNDEIWVPIAQSKTPSEWEELRNAPARPNVWGERMAPPSFELPSLPKEKRRRDWKTLPRGEQIACPGMLMFRALPRETPLLSAQKRSYTLEERVFWAEKEGLTSMTIAGVRGLKAINGHFFPYLRVEGENMKRWRARLRRMRAHLRFSKKVEKDIAREEKPLWQQIEELSQRAGVKQAQRYVAAKRVKGQRLVLLGAEESLEVICPRVKGVFVWPRRIKTMRAPSSPSQSKVFGSRFEQRGLTRKLYRDQYRQEREEFRAYRRERMARVLQRFENHQVLSLRASLERLAETCIKQQACQEFPQGQGPCCSKPIQGIECANEAFDDSWPEGKFDNLPSDSWEEPPTPPIVREPAQLIRVDYQGYGPHDFHWAPYQKYPRGQMEVQGADAQGLADADTEKKSTVELQTQVGASVASALPVTQKNNAFSEFANAESEISDSTFHDRWYTIKELEWADQAEDGEILRMKLPDEFLNHAGFLKSPSGVGFKQHMYWSGTIKAKIRANTNVRQYGQLQFSFYYGADQDINFEDLRTNIYSASQRLHALLTANVSNEVEIEIPFEYVLPVIVINRNYSELNLGTLIGKVVVPLTAASNCPKTASLKVLISIQDSKFSGMVGTSIARPRAEMFSAFASVIAARALLDKNRDAPTMITPGTPVIPINSSSWCMGSGQSTYNNVLRLNPNQVLPYPEGRVPPLDEMSVNHVASQFGMVNILNWRAQGTSGELLWSFDAAPFWGYKDYKVVNHLESHCYVIPPVAVMSSLFCYWRGSLELRVDVVGATELSGSLMIAYVPRVLKSEVLTMEECFSCAHTIYDIHENRQINFKIPFVAPTMFHPRKYNIHEDRPPFNPPGTVYLFVYNKLVVNCTIPDNCKLVCYLRGGSDFEVAVPAAPSIGLGYMPTVHVPESTDALILNREGYYLSYSGTWHYAYVVDEDYPQISSILKDLFNLEVPSFSSLNYTLYTPQIRYGSTSDHVTQFKTKNFTAIKDYVYIGQYTSAASTATVLFVINSATKTYEAKHYIQIGSDGNYIYGTAFTQAMQNKLTKFIMDRFNTKWVPELKSPGATFWYSVFYAAHAIPEEIDLFNLQSFELYDSQYWNPKTCKAKLLFNEPARGEGDERTNVEAPLASPQTSALSNASSKLLGESFSDLKDYCRRFQLYASGVASLDTSKLKNWRTVTLRFPVLPQGLNLDIGSESDVNEYWNRTRDGPIPIIASGYRFFTGGIRFRICVNLSQTKASKNSRDVFSKVFVQHRPNLVPSNEQVLVSYGNTLGNDDLELPGYAAYHQADDLNNIISVEVPFYMPSIRTYLQRASQNDTFSKLFSNLGELVVGISLTDVSELDLKYDIYYSLADDARFSVFVGFPPMIDCTQIPDKLKSTRERLSSMEIISEEDLKDLPTGQMSSSPFVLKEMVIRNDPVNFNNRLHLFFKLDNSNMTLLRRIQFVRSIWNMDDDEIDEWRKSFIVTDWMPIGREAVLPFPVPQRLFNVNQQLNGFSVIPRRNFVYSPIPDSSVVYARPQGILDWVATKLESTDSGQRVSVLADKVEAITDAVDPETIKETTSSLAEITAKVKSCLSECMPTMDSVEMKFQKYFSIITCAISQIIHCILNFNLKTFIVAIVSFLVQLKVFCFSMINSLVDSMGKVVEKLGWSSGKPELERPVGNMALGDNQDEDRNVISGYISTLIAGVAALFSIVPKFCKAKIQDIGDLIFTGLGKFAFTANHLFTFIKNNLQGIKRIGEYLFSDHPSMSKVAFLKDSDKSVHEWAEQVLELTDPRKEHEVFTSIAKASVVYRLAYQAGILNIKMLDLKLNNNQTNTISYLVKKINDLRDRLAKAHMAPPVKFEPFVIELFGKTGIGKSQLLSHLPYRLFKLNNFTCEGELIYHRALGNAYWNNLHNQPVLVIDEKFPVEGDTFLAVQLAELFQLKSSCVFNPPMADIPDKNIRYNPLIAMYASNNPFPTLPGVLDAQAVYRRRDALVEVALTAKIIGDHGPDAEYKNLTKAERGKEDRYEYLRFRFHRDPKIAKVSSDHFHGWLTYGEFETQLNERFTMYYAEEEKRYRKALNRLSSVQPEDGETSTIKQLFEVQWEKMVEEEFTKADDKKIKEQLNSLQNDLPPLNRTEREFSEIWRLRGQQNLYQLLGNYTEMRKIESKITQIQQRITPDSIPSVNQQIQTDIEAPEEPPAGSIIKANMCQPKTHYKNRACIHEGILSIANHYDNIQYLDGEQQFMIYVDQQGMLDPTFDLLAMGEGPRGMMNRFRYFFGEPEDPNSSYTLKDYTTVENLKFFLCIKERKCRNWDGSESQNCAYVKEPEEDSWRRKFMYSILQCNSLLRERRVRGDDCSKDIPSWYDISPKQKEFVKNVAEHEKHKTVCQTIQGWWYKLKETFYSINWQKWLKRIGMALILFTFIGTCLSLFNFFKNGGDRDAIVKCASTTMSTAVATKAISDIGLVEDTRALLNGEGHVSGDSKVTRQAAKQIQTAVKTITCPGSRPTGNLASGTQEHIRSRIQRNTFFLGGKGNGHIEHPGRCLGVCGQYAIVVSHYIEAWKRSAALNTCEMWFIPMRDARQNTIPIKFNDLKFIPIENSALSLVKFPLKIPAFKDIRNLILPKDQHRFVNGNGSVFETEFQLDQPAMSIYNLTFKECKNQSVEGNEIWSDFSVVDGYQYGGFSGDGCCGSVLACSNSQSPLIGIHVAGFPGSSWGYSDLIYREMFDNLGNQPDPVLPMGDGLTSRFYVDAHCIGVGKVPQKFAHVERGTSRIAPSEVQLAKEFPVLTQPAVLSKKDKRIKDNPFSPMLEGCKYHGKPLDQFPEHDIKLVVEDVKRMILAKCKPERKPGLLTVDEACGGFDGKPGYEHIEFKTSEGFPFVGLRPPGVTNKRWLFNFDENNKYESCKEELKTVLDLKWKQRLANKIPATVFTDCLKDCTIAHDKVLTPGKTRIFSMAPVDFTIQERQCTLDFVVSFMVNRHRLEHMIGCNPDSIEWTLLSRRLLEKGNNIITGDYSKYGDTLPCELIHGCFEIIRDWYKFNDCENEELQQQLKIMPFEIANSLHLMFDHLYTVVCGQPSGNSLTVILNSMVNSMYVRLAWLDIMRNTKFNSLRDFLQHCTISSYGDDLICSVDDDVKEMFNGITMQNFFKKYGLKFTNADKSDNIVKYVKLSEAEFLKRGFVDHPTRKFPQIILAPLKSESIEDTINWVWEDSFKRNEVGAPTFREMSMQVCQDSIRNAFSRGPQYYQDWSNKLITFWLKRGEHLAVDTWQQMDHKIFDQEMDLSPYHKWCLNKFVV